MFTRTGNVAVWTISILDVLFHGADGRPLEYARAWHRADQYRRGTRLARVR